MSASAKRESVAVTRPAVRPRSAKAQWNVWLRWLHTYTSMISLLVVLFFSLTGITLNHPDWVFGTQDVNRTVTGTLPSGWITNGQPDWLTVAEELRAQQGLRGRASDPRADDQQADISFLAPGYSADTVIDVRTGKPLMARMVSMMSARPRTARRRTAAPACRSGAQNSHSTIGR